MKSLNDESRDGPGDETAQGAVGDTRPPEHLPVKFDETVCADLAKQLDARHDLAMRWVVWGRLENGTVVEVLVESSPYPDLPGKNWIALGDLKVSLRKVDR